MSSDKSTASNTSRYLVKVSETIPSISECMNFVTDPTCGAISTFSGITRNNFQQKKVLQLQYEAYTPMAEKMMLTLCQTAQSIYPDICKIAMVHILGNCPVGEASVIICVSSPHRKMSLDCVAYLIDELKANVPIWKLEVYEGEEEGAVWKENVEWKNGEKTRVMRRCT